MGQLFKLGEASVDDLPLIARSLCEEVMDWIDKHTDESGREKFGVLAKGFGDVLLSKAIAAEDQLKGSKFSSMNSLFDFSGDVSELLDFIECLAINPNDEPAVSEILSKDASTIIYLTMAYFLRSAVSELKRAENQILDAGDTVNYEYAMSQLDEPAELLRAVYFYVQTMEPAVLMLSDRISKKMGASKGGNKKAEKYEPLRLLVTELARKHYSSDEYATDIARSVYDAGLSNEEKELADTLKDPIGNFIKWIRNDRKNRK